MRDENQESASTAKTSKMTSSRQIPVHARLEATAAKVESQAAVLNNTGFKTRSKFAKRFNMTGSGMSETNQDEVSSNLQARSQLGTPSTSAASMQSPSDHKAQVSNIKDTSGDESQWIKRPRGLGVLG